MNPGLLTVLLGFGVGVSLGLTGIGAGVVLTPALVVLFRLSPVTAVGTSLAFSLVTKSAGAAQHLRQETVDRDVVRWMALGSLPCALLSALLLTHGLGRAVADMLVGRLLGVALLAVAVVTTWQLFFARRYGREAGPARLVVTGVLIGTMVGLTSIGSGSVAIALLAVLTSLSLPRLIGTDMLHSLLLAVVTAPIFLLGGRVDVSLVGLLLVGSIPGVVLGSRLTTMLPERVTRLTTAVAVWSVAVKYL